MGDDNKNPAGGTDGDGAWPGEKDGKWAGSGGAERTYEAKGSEKRWGVGDLKPKPDPNAGKPKVEDPKTELAIKPLYSKQLAEKSFASSQEGDEDQTFASALTGKATFEALGASYNVEEGKAKATVLNLKVEGTAAHGQVDLIGLISDWLFGKQVVEPPRPPPTFAPMAARLLDLTTHGTPLVPGPGSPNVFIGSLPAWRTTIDMNACAAPGAAPHGAGPTMIGEPTVLINSVPAARMGDWVVEPTGGPNVIVKGCENVFIGKPAGAPPTPKPPDPKPEDLPFFLLESVASADVGAVEVTGKLAGEVDFKKGQGDFGVEGSAVAAGVKASLPLKLRMRIPFTTYYLGLGVTAEGTLGSAGVEGVAGVKVNQGKTLFGAKLGAGAHVGVGGVAAKFSVDVAEK